MRFFLITFAFTLFLFANASQLKPPNQYNYSPEEIACFRSVGELGLKIFRAESNLNTVVKSARTNYTVLSNFLESKDSNGFGNIDAGFQSAITKCKKVNALSIDGFKTLLDTHRTFIFFTRKYTRTLVSSQRFIEKFGADKAESDKINLKHFVMSYYRNYQILIAYFYKLIGDALAADYMKSDSFTRTDEDFSLIVGDQEQRLDDYLQAVGRIKSILANYHH